MWRKVIGSSLSSIGRWMCKVAKMDRLENIDAISLGDKIEKAVQLYGEPLDVEQGETDLDVTVYHFEATPFHGCSIWCWNGLIHSVVYFPEFGYPDSDLKFMFEFYGAGQDWIVENEGYSYFREDRKVRIWCSALPPIGVATMEYWQAKHQSEEGASNESVDAE